jgi:hypothetical protein
MDITPKQFNALLVEFRKIREHLEALRNDINQGYTAIYAACERHGQERHELPVPFEIKLEKDQEGKRDTESKKQYKLQNSIRKATWLTFLATTGAFIAAAYYAHYARLTFNEIKAQTPSVVKAGNAAKSSADTARDTLINSQKTFEIDERPYLVVDSHNPTFALFGLVANQKLSVNVNFKNIGKGPAIRKITEMNLVNYQAPPGKHSPKGYRSRLRGFSDNWFAKMRRLAEKATTEMVEYPSGHGEDIAPGDTWFASTHDDFVLSSKELSNITNERDTEGMLLLFIVIAYQDRFGNTYETDGCQMYFGSHTEVWHKCPVYNLIK